MTEELLKAWAFLDGLMCTGGRCSQFDAEQMLDLFPEVGTRDIVEVADDQVQFLDTGNPLDPTLWWRRSTRLFYLGVVGDDEGSLSQ